MDLRDDARQAVFRARLRDWLDPNPPAFGDPRKWSRQLHEAGFAGLTWPEEAGGAGLPGSYQGIFAEECARAGIPEHPNVIGVNMVGPTLIRHGTPAQQDRHLRPILTGEHLFCQGFSEPGAGSDLAAVRTAASRTAGGFVVSGEKIWSSYAHLADHCLLLARTEHGLTCFLLDMDLPGVSIRPIRMINGEAGFAVIRLTEVELPADSVVGEVGAGWRVAMTTLSHERGTFGVTLIARLAVQFDRLLETVRQSGAATDPVVRQTVARLHLDVEALRQTGHRVLCGGAAAPDSTILKLHWSHTHQRMVAVGCQVGGEQAAYWQRERLRSRGNTIEGGTSEILRGIIAERVAGLPRSR